MYVCVYRVRLCVRVAVVVIVSVCSLRVCVCFVFEAIAAIRDISEWLIYRSLPYLTVREAVLMIAASRLSFTKS